MALSLDTRVVQDYHQYVDVRLDFVGTLERFGEDWVALEELLAARPHVAKLPPRPPLPHRNPTPSGLSALLKHALVNDTKLLKQVEAPLVFLPLSVFLRL